MLQRRSTTSATTMAQGGVPPLRKLRATRQIYQSVLDEGCAQLNCAECPVATTCRKCSTTPEIFYLVNNKCYTVLNLPIGYGRNVVASAGTASTCQIVDCEDCKFDNLICTKCLASTSKLLFNNICTLARDLPDGKDLSNNKVVECFNADCLDCKSSYNACSKCRVGFQTAQQGCASLPRPIVVKTRFLASELNVEFYFDQEIEFVGSSTELLAKVIVVDKITAAQIGCSASSTDQFCKVSISGRRLQISFSPNLPITLGTLVIPKPATAAIRSRSSKAEFADYPLLRSDIRVAARPAAKTGSNMMQLISSSRSTMNLAMAAVNPAVSGALNRYIATMLYPSYLEGPVLVYPQYILANLQSFSLIPWSLLNVPNVLAVPTECIPSEGFDAQEVACALGANMGWDILTILLMCVPAFVIHHRISLR